MDPLTASLLGKYNELNGKKKMEKPVDPTVPELITSGKVEVPVVETKPNYHLPEVSLKDEVEDFKRFVAKKQQEQSNIQPQEVQQEQQQQQQMQVKKPRQSRVKPARRKDFVEEYAEVDYDDPEAHEKYEFERRGPYLTRAADESDEDDYSSDGQDEEGEVAPQFKKRTRGMQEEWDILIFVLGCFLAVLFTLSFEHLFPLLYISVQGYFYREAVKVKKDEIIQCNPNLLLKPSF